MRRTEPRKIPVHSRDFQIVIPTHARPTSQITLMDFPKDLRETVLVVTSTQADADAIRRKYRHQRIYAIEDKRINSIAKKRQWIMENVRATKIFMLDDDCHFFRRCASKYREFIGGMWKIKPKFKGREKFLNREKMTDKHIRVAFAEVDRLMDQFAHVCISSRMGNDKVEEEVKYVGRAMHAIGVRRDIFMDLGLRFDEVALREDFNVTLHLLRAGYPNAIIQYFTVGPKPYGAKGGCSSERTVELSDQEADALAEIHHPFVKVVEKSYGGKASTPRKETTVYWQKAYQSAFAEKKGKR